MSIFDLSGRTAVITGGNGGIGLGIAQALNAAGCNVSIWGRNADKNMRAAATLAKGPGKVDLQVCDVSDSASVKAAMKATLDVFGRVDGCFANAGIGGGGRRAFIDRTEEEWRKMFATNLDGVFHVFQVAARHMTERAEAGDRFGRLVATSSLASLFGTARNEHYAGTKAALNALCRALAVELARYGVTANAILPGWIKSDMTAGLMGNEKFVANVMPRIPVRRFGEPSDFGGIAVYIMSQASSYHTADCFVIDGCEIFSIRFNFWLDTPFRKSELICPAGNFVNAFGFFLFQTLFEIDPDLPLQGCCAQRHARLCGHPSAV